jgi:hypothetical protein
MFAGWIGEKVTGADIGAGHLVGDDMGATHDHVTSVHECSRDLAGSILHTEHP